MEKLEHAIEKLREVSIKLRERGLVEEARTIDEVIELLIPEVEPDELDLEAIREIEEAIKKGKLIPLEEVLKKFKQI